MTLATTSAPIDWMSDENVVQLPNPEFNPAPRRAGWWSWTRQKIRSGIWTLFCVASLVALLALVTAVPIFQLLCLGYLLLVAGRLTNGGTWRGCLPGLEKAGQIGTVAVMLGFAALPTQLLAHWEAVATVIEPQSAVSGQLRIAAITLSLLLTIHLWWAWARGGRWQHYLWPQPIRFVCEAWRPSIWSNLAKRISGFLWSLQLPQLFWLGFRGAALTLVWLFPAFVIMGVTRGGEGPGAGLLGGISLLALAFVLLTLPMLQANFAAKRDWRAMFAWRSIRRDFRYAPWSWAMAMLIGLVLMPIPLYLLKIEATPRELTWLPCLVFVALMLPARIAEGWALHRCRRLRAIHESGQYAEIIQNRPAWRNRLARRWWFVSRWTVRLIVMPAIVGFYVIVLSTSQYTSWNGVETWIAQHALLVPVPFTGI